MTFKERAQQLEDFIIKTYTQKVSPDEAEDLAANFLHAGLQVSEELSKVDLDARTRKSGVKAVRAAIYLESVQASDKKPTESMLEHLINTNPMVSAEQSKLDELEALKAHLERYYDLYNNAHIYYRSIAKKGEFNG